MTGPTPDWVEQARRFAAGLAAEHGPGIADWADQARRSAADRGSLGLSDLLAGLLGPPAAVPPTAEAGADHAAECRWCPVCAGLAALRGRRPDLAEALADVLGNAATALRTQAGVPPETRTTRTTPDGSDAAPDVPAPDVPAGDAPAPPEETVTHPAPAPVQRIDVA